MQLKKIRVYGKLRQFLGQSYFEAAVKSPQQAMSFLIANFDGVQKHMNSQLYKVKMGGKIVTEEYLSMSGQGDIQIIPIATGALPVVFGIAAVVGGGAITGGVLATVLSTALVSLGTSMIIQGITDFIAPQRPVPNTSKVSGIDPNVRGSYSFSGIQNVSSSGVPVPILYGLVYSGSIIISSGVDTAQVRRTAVEGTYVKSFINESNGQIDPNTAGFCITITASDHGFKTDELLGLEFPNGKATNRIYKIHTVTTNNFKVFDTRVVDGITETNNSLVLASENAAVKIIESFGSYEYASDLNQI